MAYRTRKYRKNGRKTRRCAGSRRRRYPMKGGLDAIHASGTKL